MLQIITQNAQLEIRTTRAQLNISQPPADFEIQRKQPKLNMHTEHPQIRIDQRQCFNESGLMSPEAFADYIAQTGRKAVMEGIARRTEEGSRLARIEAGGNAVAEIAYDNSFPVYEFKMVTMPRSRPKIDFVGGSIDIQVEEGYVNTIFRPNSPQIEYRPGSIEIRMRQYPHIDIKV